MSQMINCECECGQEQRNDCCCPPVEVPVKLNISAAYTCADDQTGSRRQETPNLQIGIETRLPYRYMGKQVYATLVDFGPLPNAALKNVAHGVFDADWIQLDLNNTTVQLSGGANGTLIHADTDSAAQSWESSVTKTDIAVYTKMNRSDCSAIVCIRYTKLSDVAVQA